MAILLFREIVLLTLDYFYFEILTKIDLFEINLDKSNDDIYLPVVFMKKQIYTNKNVNGSYSFFSLDKPGELMAERYIFNEEKKSSSFSFNFVDPNLKSNCVKYNQDKENVNEKKIEDVGMRFLIKCENVIKYLFDWSLYESNLFEKMIHIHFKNNKEQTEILNSHFIKFTDLYGEKTLKYIYLATFKIDKMNSRNSIFARRNESLFRQNIFCVKIFYSS